MVAGSVVEQPNSISAAEVFGGVADCRLQYSAPDTLTLVPYGGVAIIVDAEAQLIPPAGIQVFTTDNLITALGADSGAPPGTNVLLYAYISNSSVAFAAGELRLSATAPTDGNFGPQLGGITAWRFVGYAYIDVAGNLRDDEQCRGVFSYYNRRTASVSAAGGYVDNNAVNSYTPGAASANWASFSPGAAPYTFDFIYSPEEAYTFFAQVSKTAGLAATGIGIANGTQVQASIEMPALAGFCASCTYIMGPNLSAAVLVHITLKYHDDGVTAPTFTLDNGRHGNATDVVVSKLWGLVYI